MTPTIKSMTIAARNMATKRGMARAPIYLVGSWGGYLATVPDRAHRGKGCRSCGVGSA
jgi:hypothetical protein